MGTLIHERVPIIAGIQGHGTLGWNVLATLGASWLPQTGRWWGW